MVSKYKYVGQRIKQERQKYNLSLQDLAAEIDVSASYLSLLENGKTTPSIKVLDKICNYFSIHIATLFREELEPQDFIFYKKSKQIEVQISPERLIRFLMPKGISSIEPVYITLLPSHKTPDFTVHRGTEYGYVVKGRLSVHLEGQDPVVCDEGDSVIYNAAVRHVLVNEGTEPVECIWINFPDLNFEKEIK